MESGVTPNTPDALFQEVLCCYPSPASLVEMDRGAVHKHNDNDVTRRALSARGGEER